MSDTFLDRFWARVDVRGPDECWLWLGAKTTNGYGVLQKQRPAHHVSWELANAAQVPQDRVVCHRCDVRACVNPAHLWIGTQTDNMRDASRKGRLFTKYDPFRPSTMIAARIHEAARRIGSIRALCEKAGLPRSTLYRLIRANGPAGFHLETFFKLRDAGVELPGALDFFKAAA